MMTLIWMPAVRNQSLAGFESYLLTIRFGSKIAMIRSALRKWSMLIQTKIRTLSYFDSIRKVLAKKYPSPQQFLSKSHNSLLPGSDSNISHQNHKCCIKLQPKYQQQILRSASIRNHTQNQPPHSQTFSNIPTQTHTENICGIYRQRRNNTKWIYKEEKKSMIIKWNVNKFLKVFLIFIFYWQPTWWKNTQVEDKY